MRKALASGSDRRQQNPGRSRSNGCYLSEGRAANASSFQQDLTKTAPRFRGAEEELFNDSCSVSPYSSARDDKDPFSSPLRPRKESEKRRERQRAAEDWDNMNKHMASIASSLLHQQICPILIKTLGYSPPPILFPSCQLSVTSGAEGGTTLI